MAAPTITAIFPNDEQSSVPIGANIEIIFSSGIDLSTAKKSIVVYGRDFDFISGPETATWMKKDGTSSDFLKSPGFKGIVKCKYEMVYVDADGNEVELNPTLPAEEEAGPYTSKIKVIPETSLAPDMEYKVYIIGEDESGTKKAVSKRSVYDPDYTNATSTTGVVSVYGGYTGSTSDTISVKITKSGNIGTAEYKWWYSETELESTAVEGKITSRRFRKLDDGVQIRFTGSDFISDDIYTVRVEPKELLESSYAFSFNTSTDQIVEVPNTASTSVIGTVGIVEKPSGKLNMVKSSPADGDTHLKFNNKKIVIEFDREIDPDSVTHENVSLFQYPVSGIIDPADDQVELYKKITVDGNKIIIEV